MNILLIGAGGVASYLMPILQKMQVEELMITIMDGDILEERNLDRQLFTNNMIGKNKAEALAEMYAVNSYDSFYKEGSGAITTDTDCVICCVDNRESRVLIYKDCMEKKVPFITGANEMFDASGFFADPADYKGRYCLLNMFPDLLNQQVAGGFSCTGVEGEKYPQLAIANQQAAAFILHLLWTHVIKRADFSDEARNHLPFSLERTIGGYSQTSKFE